MTMSGSSGIGINIARSQLFAVEKRNFLGSPELQYLKIYFFDIYNPLGGA